MAYGGWKLQLLLTLWEGITPTCEDIPVTSNEILGSTIDSGSKVENLFPVAFVGAHCCLCLATVLVFVLSFDFSFVDPKISKSWTVARTPATQTRVNALAFIM